MSTYQMPHDEAPSSLYRPSLVAALLVAMTVASAVFLLPSFAASTPRVSAAMPTAQATSACSFAATGEADVSGICN